MSLFLSLAGAPADDLSCQEEYEAYRKEMPWLAVPFKVQATRQQIVVQIFVCL